MMFYLPEPLHDLSGRITGEYRELPGLQLTLAQASQLGDMSQDRAINATDFLAFRTAFDNANGVGAFTAADIALLDALVKRLEVKGVENGRSKRRATPSTRQPRRSHRSPE